MTSELTAEDFFRTITGYDEIAVSRAFKEDIAALRERPFRFIRALAFIAERRDGAKDSIAYAEVMNMTVGDLEEYFAEPVDEIDPDAPETDQGKGDTPQ